jgi:peptidoglycan/LPS O-acetylase OafA/YrhL
MEKFRPQWWRRLTDSALWLWLPGLALIGYALYLSDADEITVAASVWQFPLIALGMAALLVCAVSPRLPFRRIRIPGVAFIASIAYSAYLIQKLVIHFVEQLCSSHGIILDSILALIGVQVCVYAVATILFFVIERPFLQLRHRLTNHPVR